MLTHDAKLLMLFKGHVADSRISVEANCEPNHGLVARAVPVSLQSDAVFYIVLHSEYHARAAC
jgi:hypothetical protein